MPAADVFTRIYEEGTWGNSPDPTRRYFSGSGSASSKIVEPYVRAIESFLLSLERKPDVVDLGCGDFFVGSRIRGLCGRYIACDIVVPLIRYNAERWREMNVDFRVVDITHDPIPAGDVFVVRQVFQHLSNEQIVAALEKIVSSCRFLVVTEHLPRSKLFRPNLDKPAGPDIRLRINSGVVLTEPPFNLQATREEVLCEVAEYGGRIKTTLFESPSA